MRGGDRNTGALFSYVNCEERVAKDHPLRAIREITNAALAALSPEFEKLYARVGRPSIAPEKLLRVLLLQAFYSVRSERQLMEQLDYNLLFRWFVGLGMDAPIWDVTVFTKNRERLVEGEIASKFMAAVLSQPRVRELLSSEHFSVDGTLIEAWASMKSFRPKDGSGEPPAAGRNSLPRRRPGRARFSRRETPQRDARLDQRSGCAALSQGAGSGGEAGLYGARDDGEPPWSGGRYTADPGDRHGRARGGAGHGQGAAGQPPHHGRRRQGLRCCRLRRSIARAQRHAACRPEHQQPALGDRRPHHPPSRLRHQRPPAQTHRGDLRMDQGDGRIRKTRHRGVARVGWIFTLTATAYNLVRLPKLLGAAA